ncbi:polysaccharide biosynthesis protein [Aerococcus viridans]|uniref:Polysaccharide biosynthesis protein n=1 Tax=Aerococcus viridans TaxID=1377 RepID=A0A2J9PMG4_9LACT|nr:polysaccharide biosynthesis protein [Aerococcus viridans]PNL91251.1 polysaccharide biosynthesis protein [Aerococcus viridans]
MVKNDDSKARSTGQAAMQGAAVLTLAALVAKVLSAIYRVPLQNMVGNEGFYVYQQVYPIYGIGMTFALNGLPSFIGKQVALQNNHKQSKSLLKRYAVIVSVFALACFALVYFGADWIAAMMGDSLLTPVIKSVSFMFLLMPGLLLSRGFMQGRNLMTPTAISQVTEQFVRVAVILTVAFIFSRMEVTDKNPDVYQMGFWTMQSAWIAAAAASIVMAYYLLNYREKAMYQDFLAGHYGLDQASDPDDGAGLSWTKLTKDFVTEGFVICFFSVLLVFYQLIDAFTVYDQLVDNGIATAVAKDMKGIYDRGQPIVQLGMVVATSLATSFLPTLALVKKGDRKEAGEFEIVSRQYLRVTLFFATIITGGLISIMPQLNHFLFASSAGSEVLMVYVVMVILASLVLGQNNILQAQGQWYKAGIAFMVGMLVKGIFTAILVGFLGTVGAAWATNLGLVAMIIYLDWTLPKEVRLLKWERVAFKAGLLAVLMVAVNFILAYLWHQVLGVAPERLMDALLMGIQILVGVLLVVGYLRKDPILNQVEWETLPKGELIWRLLQG